MYEVKKTCLIRLTIELEVQNHWPNSQARAAAQQAAMAAANSRRAAAAAAAAAMAAKARATYVAAV